VDGSVGGVERYGEPDHGGRPETALLGGEVLAVRGVSKRFGGVQALDGVDLTVSRGEIHAIVGENGAGKSTLVKIIAAVTRPDQGEVRVDGKVLRTGLPQETRAAGVAVVYQELSLVPQLSVAHNLVLSRLPTRAGVLSLRKVTRIAQEMLDGLGLAHIDPRAVAGSLPLDQQQMLEIAKVTATRPKILVLDEATSSLGAAEVDRLFGLVRAFRDEGTTILVITHRMREVWNLADSMTILRDGKKIARLGVTETNEHEVVRLMAGRDVQAIYPPKGATAPAAPVLDLREVRLRSSHKPWALELRRGEILGLGGLEGQCQREFILWLYGVGRGTGTMVQGGARIKISRPSDALAHGIVLIPEDRKVHGLHLGLPVRWNLAMATLGKRSRFGFIRMRAEREFALTAIGQAAIRVKSPFDLASTLSGGTQQKVVLRKFLACNPSILLFVDAMRGIDVQTKFGFYQTLRELTSSGNSCILYSSDTEELVGLCDRIAVFHDGVPARILEGADITQDDVVAASFAVGADGK